MCGFRRFRWWCQFVASLLAYSPYHPLNPPHTHLTITPPPRNIKAVKEVTKFSSGAPSGYTYKGNIEHGPLIKIKVDESSKIIDWKKVKVHAFQSSLQEEESISDDEEREEVERKEVERRRIMGGTGGEEGKNAV